MKKALLTPLLILFAGASASAAESVTAPGADVDAGKAKSAVCAGCHGVDGNSMVPSFPKIAGQHVAYLVKQLEDLKANEDRSNPIMLGQAAILEDEDMRNLAAYFASQKMGPGTAQGDEETIALGKRIYHGGNADTGVPACMACHGPEGAGNALAGFPALAGQHAGYTSVQIKAFRAKERKNDAKSMMRDATERLTDKEIEAVSQYIAGL